MYEYNVFRKSVVLSKAYFLKFLTFTIFLLSLQVGFSQDQKNVLLLDIWNDTTIPIAVEDARYSDIWGFEVDGQNYCAVGSSEGVEILSVGSNGLTLVDRKAAAFQGFTVVHRDYKTYRNYLYAVGDEGMATLQIFDLSYLPDSISKVYDSNALFGICHNIYIDTAQAKLYACGANNTGMKVLDLTDPENPVLLQDFNNVTYVHDAYVTNDTAFLNCGFDGLHVYDFSGPIPIQIGAITFYPDQGYNHSGWLSPDRSKYVFIDETEGTKIKLCYINDIGIIQIDETFGTADYEEYVPHNVILFNKLAFVAYYNEGFRVFDVSKTPIKEIAHYDTFEDETAYKLNGAWGVYVFDNTDQIVICDRQYGVHLFSFPIDQMEADSTNTVVTNTPFIDENSFLIPRSYLDHNQLYFTISDLRGAIVYRQESYLNWVGIPLNLRAGAYFYGIYNEDGELLESGKFCRLK